MIAPHPGLLAIAQTLKIDLGITIIAGIFVRLLQHGVRCLLPFVGRRPGVPQVRSIAEKLSARGATVFVTSHVLEIVEKLYTNVGIIAKGKLVYQG